MFDEEALNELSQMQRLHRDTERIFLSLNRIIPYDYNEWSVKSPRYINIISATNPQILGMFSLITRGLRLQTRDTFGAFFAAVNRDGMLSKLKVALREDLK